MLFKNEKLWYVMSETPFIGGICTGKTNQVPFY